LKIFNNTKLKFQSGDLRVYVSSLKYGEYQKYQPDDGIMEIDIENKTFFVELRGKFQRTVQKQQRQEKIKSDFYPASKKTETDKKKS
jgi:hypothetical protein